jgi:hypothetical protein
MTAALHPPAHDYEPYMTVQEIDKLIKIESFMLGKGITYLRLRQLNFNVTEPEVSKKNFEFIDAIPNYTQLVEFRTMKQYIINGPLEQKVYNKYIKFIGDDGLLNK